MAGLLDALFPGTDGGLLDFLKRNANTAIANTPDGAPGDVANYGPAAGAQMPTMPALMAQPQPQGMMTAAPISANQPSPLDNAQWPYGPIGAPSQAMARMPAPPAPVAQPAAMPAAPAAAPAMSPLIPPSTGGFGAAGRGALANVQNGPLGMLLGGIAGFAGMGQPTPQQQQAQIQNLTARALVAKGIDPQVAIAAVQPGNGEMLKTLIAQSYGPHPAENLGQGYIRDPLTGKVTRAYTPEQNDSYNVVQTGQDAMGNKTYSMVNKATGDIKPVGAPVATGGGLGDMNKTGEAYLATVPLQQQGILRGMVDGTIQPPSSFALSKPYWQTMLAAAKNLDPTFDENTWAARHKMSTDIASSGNSSMGGILANGKSSFSHLADLSDSMAGLGNASHDFPLGSALATAQNYVGNHLGGSDTQAKIKAINDNLGHYGQESTKFYSGTGGGAEERMNALKEMNPAYTSSEEMAAYLSKEKDLMLARLREKEDDIRKTMGDKYLQQHPVFTPQFQQIINRIDANVARLKGQPVNTAAAPQGAPTPGAYVWSPDKGLAPK